MSANTIISANAKKCALVIGINYNTVPGATIDGCTNDAQNIFTFLTSHCGYAPADVVILTDDINPYPSKAAIMIGINNLVQKAVTGGYNEVWLSFSGHGSYTDEIYGNKPAGFDEVLAPVDYIESGNITDDWLNTNLVQKLPNTCNLICLFDACFSGTCLDLPYAYAYDPSTDTSSITDNNDSTFTPLVAANYCNALLISGCNDNQFSASIPINNVYQGLMTYTFLSVLDAASYSITCTDLLTAMNMSIYALLPGQYPELTFSRPSTETAMFMAGDLGPYVPPLPQKTITFTTNIDTTEYFNATWQLRNVDTKQNYFARTQTFKYQYQQVVLNLNLTIGNWAVTLMDATGQSGQRMQIYNGTVKLVDEIMLAQGSLVLPFVVQ